MHEAVPGLQRYSGKGKRGADKSAPLFRSVQLTGAADCILQSTSTGALGIVRSTRRSCEIVR